MTDPMPVSESFRTESRILTCACGATTEREIAVSQSGKTLGSSYICPACVERDRQEEQATERQRVLDRNAALASRRKLDAIALLATPPLFADARLGHFRLGWGSKDQHRATEAMLAVARDLMNHIVRGLKPPALVAFSGSPGNGKSSCAFAIANELASEHGITCRAVSCADLVRYIRGAWRKGDTGPDEDTRIASFVDPDFLVIDEVSSHAFYGQNIHQHLFDVINGRLNYCRPTLMTTNESESELAAILRPALFDRLQLGGIVDCGRESYREWRANEMAAA